MQDLIKKEIPEDIRVGKALEDSIIILNNKIKDHDKYISVIRPYISEHGASVEDIYITLQSTFKWATSRIFMEAMAIVVYLIYLLRGKYKKSIQHIIDTDSLFLERLYIRIVLVKNGWNDESIEKLISRYYNIKWNNYYFSTYVYLRKFTNTEHKILTKGRPQVPSSIRELLTKYKETKNKLKMRSIYTIYKEITHLFTKEDIAYLHQVIPDDKQDLKQKLLVLSKYT